MQVVDDYTLEEENLIVQSALEKREQKLKLFHDKLHYFQIRSDIIQSYFIRLSAPRAVQFFLQLVDHIKGVSVIFQILQLMFTGKIKLEIYSNLDSSPDFIFDKVFASHNRMLDEKTLSETMENDTKWFAKLDGHMQINIIVDLFRAAGGGIRAKLYMPVAISLHNKLRSFRKKSQISTLSTVKLLKYSDDVEKYDPNHPSSIEVDKQRKRWDAIIAKYENEVNSKAKFLLGEDKPQKATKKLNKEVKTNNKFGKVICNDIDWLQLLPVEYVKKIFSYLNMTDLQRAKKVNSYWAYIVLDIIKERKTRENLNRYLEQLKRKIDPLKLKNAIEEFGKKKSVKLLKRTPLDIGMIAKKLVPKRTPQMVETSLISEALKLENQHYPALSGEFLAFPRVTRLDMKIFRYKPCFLKDTNLQLGINDDINRQRSVLTYSLSAFTSTIQLNMPDDVSLEDW